MATLKQKFTGDASQLAKEYTRILQMQIKQEQGLLALKNQSNQLGATSTRMGGAVKQANDSMLRSLKSTAAGYLSIHAAVQLVNSELQNKIRLREEAAATSHTMASGQAAVVRNLGDVSPEVAQEFTDSINNIAEEINFPKREAMFHAASATLSGTDANRELTLDVMRAAGRLTKNDTSELPDVASAIADVSSLTGFSAKEAAALINSTQKKARLEKASDFAQVATAIAAGINAQPGINPKQAAQETAALIATFTQGVKDRDGAITKTAVSAMASSLRQVFEFDEQKFQKLIGQGRSVKDARAESLLSLAERVDKAQAVGDRVEAAINAGTQPSSDDTKLLDSLLKTGLRAPQKLIAQGFFGSNDNASARYFDSALSEIKPDIAALNRKYQALESSTVDLRLADSKHAVDTRIQSSELENLPKSMGTAWEIYKSTLGKTSNFFGGSATKLLSEVATGSRSENEQIESMIETLRARRRKIISVNTGTLGIGKGDESKLPTAAKADVELIDEAIKQIWKIDPNKVERRNAKLLDQVFDTTGAGRRFMGEVPFRSPDMSPRGVKTSTFGFSDMATPDDALEWLRKREDKIRIGEYRSASPGQLPPKRTDAELSQAEKSDVSIVREAIKQVLEFQKRDTQQGVMEMQKKTVALGNAALQANAQTESD